MKAHMELYKIWSSDPYFDEKTRKELALIQNDPKEIEERFYREMTFGTGGLRGILGAGTNRVNLYTISKATAGLARYIKSMGSEAAQRGVMISYDSRCCSPEFAHIAAGTLAGEGVKVYLSDTLRPVPVLSFAVRYYQAFAGIMITASHNPPKYNGYKVYGEDGGQVTLEAADEILMHIGEIEDIRTIKPISLEQAVTDGYLEVVGDKLDEAYTAMLMDLVIDRPAIDRQKEMPIVFTPLHGSANLPVRKILSGIGFSNVYIVKEQELPDGKFPTVKVPNPEDPAALQMGIELAKKVSAGIVIGTDPDGDRIGVAVLDRLAGSVVDGTQATKPELFVTGEETYRSLTGNQIGLMLLDYILEYKQRVGLLPENSFAVTTIVSSRLAGNICAHYGVELQEVLTGFKFIGERIKIDDEEGDKHFQFGFEESYGYLSGVNVRDKDAVVSAMLIAGMAAQSIDKGQTLIDRLENLYSRFGYGHEEAVSFTLEGKEGAERIKQAMSMLREEAETATPQTAGELLNGVSVLGIRDYMRSNRYDFSQELTETSDIALPSSNVIIYELGGEKGLDWACVRPSGTEPKLKIYFGAYGTNKSEVLSTIATIKETVIKHVKIG